MKLRYYMRGLGIGIIVTALIMGITLKDGRPLTDAEIRAAAYELGMVESDSLKLSDIRQSESSEPDDSEVNSPSDGDEAEANPEMSEEPKSTEEPKPTEEPEATKAPENTTEPENTPEPEETPEPTPTPEPEETPTAENEETVEITIVGGSGSGRVSRQLEEAGLVENAGEFDQYLMKNGYDRRISVGTYEITVGADWEQIAKIITRTK